MAAAINITDTIAAISTPPGKGGVAVIRISGDRTPDILKKVFSPRGSKDPQDNPRTQIYGEILRQGNILDDGMATYFPAPHSYTGENVAEISMHAGTLLTASALEAILAEGARAAEPGEFTKRAYINGKLTLSDAEGIGLLLDADSEGQIKLGKSDARERLRIRIAELTDGLVSLLSSMYARIDYPEEDLGEYSDKDCLEELEKQIHGIRELKRTYKTGRAVRDGIRTVLIGKPNSGKSTLYNLLLGEDAAIVTDIPGTTRDLLEARVTMGDILLRLYDTAGIREGDLDKVEAIGIDRTLRKAQEGQLILALFDASEGMTEEARHLIEKVRSFCGAKIAVITKSALAPKEKEALVGELRGCFDRTVSISAKESPEQSLKALGGAITDLFRDEDISIDTDPIISSANQYGILLRAEEHLCYALEALKGGLPQDVASSDIEVALEAMGELDGRGVSEAVVSEIFSKFCVGK